MEKEKEEEERKESEKEHGEGLGERGKKKKVEGSVLARRRPSKEREEGEELSPLRACFFFNSYGEEKENEERDVCPSMRDKERLERCECERVRQ